MIDTTGIAVRNGKLWLEWPDVYPYDIALNRIPDQEALGSWVRHLSEKRWMNEHRIVQFVLAATKAKKWMLPKKSKRRTTT